MHHFIYPTKTTWISSGSRKTDGKALTEQNFGKDEILELKKEFYNLSFDYPTRVMLQFDLTSVSESINSGEIPSPSLSGSVGEPYTGSKFYLKLYEAEGNQEQSSDYNITGNAISESWDEGRGKFGANPQVKDGVSWNFRKFPVGGSGISWATSGSSFISQSGFDVSQSFSSSKPDIEMDITRIARAWLSGSIPISGSSGSTAFDMSSPVSGGIANNGILLSFSGSQETDTETFGQLKFFSRNTNTIYSPKLEVRWDDHVIATGSATGSLLQITSSGLADNYIYQIRNKGSYKEDEKIKFRFGVRKRYIQKSFNTSVQEVSGSFIPEGNGSYSIVDIGTGETIVPFSSYTTMSCDATSNYFNQWLTGFETDRYYKILIKVKYDDKQEHIFDNDFEFKVKR
jgi:hypothetical protein